MGDKPGHKFRGNQWSGASGKSRKGRGGGAGATVVKTQGVLDQASSAYPPARGKEGEPETLDRYLDEDGNLTPERAALHKAIEDKAFEGKTPVDNPQATILGGGPAAGKTEMEDSLNLDPNTVRVNPDDVRVQFPEWKENVGKPGTDGTALAMVTHEEASMISKNMVARGNAGGYNVLVDGTGDSDYPRLEAKMNAHKASGQKVVARYATKDVDLAVHLAKVREKKVGRGVPEAYQRQTYRNVANVVPRALRDNLFDDFELFDTNIKGQGRKVASHKNGKTTIHNQSLYDTFLAQGSS